MFGIEAYGVVLIPIIMGLIEVAKILGLPRKYAPLLAVILGVAAGTIYANPDSLRGGILIGIALGLSSVGLYSGTRNFLYQNKCKESSEDD
ncbi:MULTISPECIES: hypothetical protein [unclassified Virgibacillus]|uniref:hypothetical protein n=1 Tax=unclassified Virgibacillus TaxID=2620237 RepID=UPI0024DE70F9|nr:hypothetical protein [Virgibacillus sp. LDC-1]